MSIMCEECKCTITLDKGCANNCFCCNGEKVNYFTTCETCEEQTNTATILEGVGTYDRESNTLYGDDCTRCGSEVAIENWFDDCEECGQLHPFGDDCGFEPDTTPTPFQTYLKALNAGEISAETFAELTINLNKGE